jgi:hypothetical protein
LTTTKEKLGSLQHRTALAQILDKITNERPGILSQQEALRHEDEQIERDLAAIQDRRAQRNQGLTMLRNNVAQATKTHTEARSLATVAEGTIGEKEAVLSLQRAKAALEAATRDLDAQEERSSKSEEQDTSTQQKLLARRKEIQDAIAANDARLQDFAVVESKKRLELGEVLLEEAMSRLQATTSQVTAKKEEVIEAQLAHQHVLEEELQKLADWPAMVKQVRAQYAPYEDAVTRLSEAMLTYIDQLLANGYGAPHWFSANGRGGHWFHFLAIQEDLINRVQHGNPTPLKAKRVELEAFLKLYRESKQG